MVKTLVDLSMDGFRPFFQQMQEKVILAAKVMVEGAFADARGPADLIDACMFKTLRSE